MQFSLTPAQRNRLDLWLRQHEKESIEHLGAQLSLDDVAITFNHPVLVDGEKKRQVMARCKCGASAVLTGFHAGYRTATQ